MERAKYSKLMRGAARKNYETMFMAEFRRSSLVFRVFMMTQTTKREK